MSVTTVTGTSLTQPNSDVERLKKLSSSDVKAEKERLKKATQAFESFFMYQLLKTMRKTVPDSPLSQDAPMSGKAGKEIFTEMFDMQLAEKMVTGSDNSISGILYRSLEKLIDAKYVGERSAPDIKSLKVEAAPALKLDNESRLPLEAEPAAIELESEVENFAPVRPRATKIRENEILARYGQFISEASEKTSLDPALIMSVIQVESNGDASAVSHAGAKGLMQLIDSTAADYGVTEVFDPQQNIEAGSRFLRDLLDRFGSLRTALAAYNAGPGNVMRYGGIPPFKETEAYVEKVIDTLQTFGHTVAPEAPKE